MVKLSFQKIETVPTTGLSEGRIYFETSTGVIKIATSDTTTDKFGDGVKSASWNSSSKTLTIINESNEEIVLDMGDIASATGVVELLAKKLNIGTSTDASTVVSYHGLKKYTDDKISTAIGGVYKMKGSLATVDLLTALTGVIIGDTYNIIAAGTLNGEQFEAGSNFVAIKTGAGSQVGMWDKLGGVVDLSNYATKVNLTDAFQALTKPDFAPVGEVVKSIVQTNGMIQVYRRTLEEIDIPTLATTKITGLDTALADKVPATRTINAKPLSSNVVLEGKDIVLGGTGMYKSDTISSTIEKLDIRVNDAESSGVTSFGTKTGVINLAEIDTTHPGSINLAMNGNMLVATIYGLGSAAYVHTSWFDSKGSSATALVDANAYSDSLMTWTDFN